MEGVGRRQRQGGRVVGGTETWTSGHLSPRTADTSSHVPPFLGDSRFPLTTLRWTQGIMGLWKEH